MSSHVGVPIPFVCYYCCEVENGSDVKKRLHIGLDDHRINPKREFFRIKPEKVKILLEGYATKDVTLQKDFVDSQEEPISPNRKPSVRPAFTFSMVGIPIGAELRFLYDKTKVSKVIGDRKVEYEGDAFFLSPLSTYILKKHFGENTSSHRGPNYWIFENETLTDRRTRMENAPIPEKDFVDSQEEPISPNRKPSRRPAFTFSMVDIPIGAELRFLYDETKVSKVTGDRKVEYEGDEFFLSPLSSYILKTHFGENPSFHRGPDYWIFENETLTTRRIRMENAPD